MRLLVHGGGSRAERVRLGSWPEIPGAMLVNGRGIAPGAPAFGLGVLRGRPFLIHRERANEDPESPACSLLFEPRPQDFERFRWNAAWLLASLLTDRATRHALLDEPESVTEESLAMLLDRCAPVALENARGPHPLAGLMARATLERSRVAASLSDLRPGGLPRPEDLAAALEDVPVALRTGRGWIVGGLDAHAEVLGCALFFDAAPAPSADPSPGLTALARLERLAQTNAEVAHLLATPHWDWGSRGEALMTGLEILDVLETRPAQAWELLGSLPAREGPLAAEIRAKTLRSMDESSTPLGLEATALRLAEAESGRSRIPSAVAERLDRGALTRHLAGHGIPPAPWPPWIETPETLRAELWARRIESADGEWATLAARAIEDLAPDGERSDAALGVLVAGIRAARGHHGNPLDWEGLAARPAYPELGTLLAEWARENVLRMRGDSAAVYLILGRDPGGAALARANAAGPIAGRFVLAVRDELRGPHAEIARAWLESLATSALRRIVPMKIKLELPVAVGGRWTTLEKLRQAYEGTPAAGEAAPAEERPFLDEELQALAQRAPAGGPNLAALLALFGGELEERTRQSVTRWTKPARGEEPRATGGWLAGVAGRLRGSSPPRPATGGSEETPAKSTKPVKPVSKAPARTAPAPATTQAREPAAPEPTPTPAPAPTGLELQLREWILGGDHADDRRADDEMIRFFEQAGPDDLAAARAALWSASGGMLYRLAARASENPALLDSLSRALDGSQLDRFVADAARYDPASFARQVAERLRRRHDGTAAGAVDDALSRFLGGGPPDLRSALVRELRAIDATLLPESSASIPSPAPPAS